MALEEELEEGLVFSLKSVIITVKSPTVTSRCWALLLSTFFNLGLWSRDTETVKHTPWSNFTNLDQEIRYRGI